MAKGPAGPWELYDMTVDRTEMNDLARREPAQLRTMVAQWESWAKRAHVLPWIWQPAYGEADTHAGGEDGGKRAGQKGNRKNK